MKQLTGYTTAEGPMAVKTVVGKHSISGLLLLTLWLALNTVCNFINRILFHHFGWHFPVLLTLIHGFTSMVLYLVVTKGLRLQKFEEMNFKFFIFQITPMAVFGCATTILNNEGLDMIDVATVTIIKSTTPIWTALIAWLAFGRKEPFFVYPLFIMASIGVTVAVSDQLGEHYSTIGLILVLGSAITRAVASILSEYIMKKPDASQDSHYTELPSLNENRNHFGVNNGMMPQSHAHPPVPVQQKLHPMSLVFYSNPVEIALLLPLFIGTEAIKWEERNLIGQNNISSTAIWLFIIFDCLLVFLLRFITNLAIKNTSSISISVFAQVKFVASIIISVIWFGYSLPFYKFVGVVFVVLGTFLYGILDNSGKFVH